MNTADIYIFKFQLSFLELSLRSVLDICCLANVGHFGCVLVHLDWCEPVGMA